MLLLGAQYRNFSKKPFSVKNKRFTVEKYYFMYFKLNYFITVFIRAIFFKTILAQNESSLGEIRLFFRIIYEILSDNLVSVNFFGPHFDPLGMGSKYHNQYLKCK
jgi:hypothetical protein